MNFTAAQVRGVKADIAKKSITLTFVVSFQDLEEAEELAAFTKEDAGNVDLEITPQQPQLPRMK